VNEGDGGGRPSTWVNGGDAPGGCGSPSSYMAVDTSRVSEVPFVANSQTKVLRSDLTHPTTIVMVTMTV
jgi:hypothetical protein